MLAAFHITFFGTQPTFTQVPPKRCASITADFAPYSAARCAQARPPLPPPTLIRSKCSVDTVNSIQKEADTPMIYFGGRQLAKWVLRGRSRDFAGRDRRSDRVCHRHLQWIGEPARERQGVVGEHRRAAE